jgi:hypothetical protein
MSDIIIDNDSGKFKAGDGQDLNLYHNGTNSFIENETGILYVTNKANANMVFGTNNTARITVEADGDIGINETSPTAKLDVDGDIQIKGANALLLNHTTGAASDTYINSPSSNNMGFRTGGTLAMTIDSSQQVGIGTSSPDSILHIKGGADWRPILKIENTSTGNESGILQFHKVASDSSEADNDYLGGIEFHGINSNNDSHRFAYMYGISSDVTDGTEDGRIDFLTAKAGTDTITMTLSSGNVGIGTTAPAGLLEVENSSGDCNVYITAENASNSRLYFGDQADVGAGFVDYDHNGNTMKLGTNGTTRLTVGTDLFYFNGLIGVGHDSPQFGLTLAQGTGDANKIGWEDGSNNKRGSIHVDGSSDDMIFQVGTSNNERMRITDGGTALIGRTSDSFNNDGCLISSNSFIYLERSTGTSNSVLYVHRRDGDGNLIDFYESNSLEGSVSVSGSTVSYNGFSGTHDSSGIASNTEIGTVLSTIDEEHKADHAKVKVSDSVGDKRVYGVLQQYVEETTNDDTEQTIPEHAVVASVGIGSVKVTGVCKGGDLLESNGDGTAKVQDDDIIRSKTIGKVTIGDSKKSVKLVSCVLYCG